MKTSSRIPKTFLAAFRGLTPSQMREVVRFAIFIRTRPDQAYFWTNDWQSREHEATRAKRSGRVLGDGTAEGLIRSLR